MTYRYPVSSPLSIPEEANPRRAELSRREADRGYRVIGGDQGDLYFGGYVVEDGETILIDPVLSTSWDGLTEDEVYNMAYDILLWAYNDVGVEVVEHS